MLSKKYFRGCVLRVAIFICFVACPSLANAQESVEYQVKAAFVHKFIKFTTWPESAFSGPNDPVIIGVLGDSPILPRLKKLERKRAVGRPVKIVEVRDPCLEQKCHILFVCKAENINWDEIPGKLDGPDTLTIGESKGFSEKGGMINFIIVDGKIRFEINVGAIEKSGLRLSSKLLRLGKIVETNLNP